MSRRSFLTSHFALLASPSMARTLIVVVAGVLAGCSSNSELQEARRQTAECRLELEALRQQAGSAPNVAMFKAQRDRLEAQCEQLKNEIARLKAERREPAGPPIARSDEQAQKYIQELQKRMERLQVEFLDGKHEWERALAERQRQIDVLTNQVERLQKELAAAKSGARGEQ